MKIKTLVMALLASFSFTIAEAKKKSPKLVDNGHKVAVEYTGKLKDGRVFDSNAGKAALEFQIGAGSMLEDFENAFLGMAKGETKTIEIPAKRAYGEFDPKKIIEIKREKLPSPLVIGDVLNLRVLSGNIPVRVVDLNEKTAFVDANHFLAGEDLVFEVKLLSIK